MAVTTKDFIGWYGASAVLVAYAFVSVGLWEINVPYLILNATGSAGLMYISFSKKAYGLSAFYFFWTLVAVVNLVRI